MDPSMDTTLQPYAYAGNDPVSLTDSSGLDFWSDLVHNVGTAAESIAVASGCLEVQALAFGAGALDSVTFGASSAVLGAVVPGYNDFVAGHQAAFDAGSTAVTVIQLGLAIATGVGAVVAIAAVVVKAAVKAAVKVVAKVAERAAVRAIERTVERDAVQTAERGTAEAEGGAAGTPFWADTRAPDEIFNNRFMPKGGNMNLLQHATQNPADSGFVSTTHSLRSAQDFAAESQADYIYKLRGTGLG